jgi:hypothetical protein
VHRGLSTSRCYLKMFSDRLSGDGNARVLVFCDATKVFDNETFFQRFHSVGGPR